ncbi:MAG TPA: proline--tRNA ligase [Solirubrobacterales bacterium]|nr:proline--tRNA ligase [Solirubrobacterales bacterium]
MTRISQTLLPTLKDAPADAEAVSHKLLVRAGMVRQMGTGLWTYLPAGWRSHRKVEQIIREEMDAIGAQEMSMPIMQPAEPWKKTGRYGIDELFKLEDRKGSPMVLAMTHEECITGHMANEVRSYRDLPQLIYQFQTKERDEPRPRAGILRTREFVMKDAYSFDRDFDGLDATYNRCIEAYDRIFDRTGLRWYRVEADVGMMGGSAAHEYMAPCDAGEDTIAIAPGYAANIEVACAVPRPIERPEELSSFIEVETPGLKSVEAVSSEMGVDPGALIKSVPMVTDDGDFILVLVRGDHQLNPIKLAINLGVQSRPANEDEIAEKLGPPGFIGPVGAKVRVIKDKAIQGGGLVAGANRADLHLKGVEPGRDFKFEEMDVRTVRAGDTTEDGHEITLEAAIEVANIFKLGTRYSEALGATYLDEDGQTHPIVMGSYGIGPARIVAAAAEQLGDGDGLRWPPPLAPWQVHLVSLAKQGDPERETAETLYEELKAAGLDVIYDDRDAGPGQKLKDAELLGCPLRIVVGRKGLADGIYEAAERMSGEVHRIPVEGGAAAIAELSRSIV